VFAAALAGDQMEAAVREGLGRGRSRSETSPRLLRTSGEPKRLVRGGGTPSGTDEWPLSSAGRPTPIAFENGPVGWQAAIRDGILPEQFGGRLDHSLVGDASRQMRCAE
jgi:hypothetical protein